MSVQAIRWAVSQQSGSSASKLVLLVLAEASNEHGFTFVGHDEIARRAELTSRAVIAQMKKLEDAGLLTRQRRFDARGWRTSNGITLTLEPAAQGEPASPRAKVNDVHLGPALSEPDDVSKVNLTTVQGERGSPYPSSYPLVDPIGADKGRRTTRRKPETTIPDGFPGELEIEAARSAFRQAGVNLDPALQASKFRDHALAMDKRFRDWPAGFRTWIANAISWAKPKERLPVQSEPSGPVSAEDAWRAHLRSYAQTAYWNTTDWGARPGQPGCKVPLPLLAAFGHVEGVDVAHSPKFQRGAA